MSITINDYSSSARKQLDSYAHDVKWRIGKYETSAENTGLVQGGVLGALTFGATMGLAGFGGLGAGIAAGTGSGLVGIGHYMNTSNIANKLGNFETVNVANNHQYDGMSGNLDQMARYGRSGLEKMPISEPGGLKQAVEHFNMRSVPRLQDLPQLSESLGKIVSLKDIEGLTLGLPSMTAASGKKYNYEVLYDNEFIKKLKKVSKKLGEPYLNPNSTINPNTNTRNMVTAYG
ncbi:hypothetical protein [Candidatus Tisiphia endosymbiont of Hybos culiciformis]|uniref:hypothetical protein n=1 Tax=Candidatus Tisiphia endosymbiont of Hybos culiciformis TaxID=3139331 RepID=UPI003CCA9851